jgi:tripartite-type tricarboxylate transporter receptor subunit TctC
MRKLAGAIVVTLLAVPLTSSLVSAQSDYPQKPVHVIVPFPAGGAMDVGTRILLDGMAPRFSKPFVVENRPGASGNIGTGLVARSEPDGHMLLLGIAANTAINKYLYTKLPFDPDRDLTPVAQFGVSTNVVYVQPSFPASNLMELLSRLKEKPGRHNYVTPGNGTTPHLSMELIKARTKTYVVHVPFKGSPAAVGAVLSGEAAIGVDAVIAVAPNIRAGKLRAIAVSGTERSSVLPEVPTLRESGLDIEASTYLGLFAPSNTPVGIVRRLEAAIAETIQLPQVATKLQRAGIEPMYRNAEAFSRAISKDSALWREAVRYSGATTY